MDGVVRTSAGYTGGAGEQPSYRSLGGHSEAVRVVFDPARVSYAALLEAFWASHDPTAQSGSRQYRNAVFYADETQRAAAQESRSRVAARLGRPVTSGVEPAGAFWPAEAYHQKYYLRGSPALYAELRARFRSEAELLDSTVAARVNGYLGGHGSGTGLERDLPILGLSPAGVARLREAVGGD